MGFSDHLNLRLVMTIIVQKPFVTSIPIHPIFPTDPLPPDSFINPLVGVEVVGEPQKEAIVKGRYSFKENTMYVYFPSDIPVDERVNVSATPGRKYSSTATKHC